KVANPGLAISSRASSWAREKGIRAVVSLGGGAVIESREPWLSDIEQGVQLGARERDQSGGQPRRRRG
ncbi:hypothetical protein CQA78_31110, partial [Klebsiella pneumoniae]